MNGKRQPQPRQGRRVAPLAAIIAGTYNPALACTWETQEWTETNWRSN
jgi:hypothetical protein